MTLALGWTASALLLMTMIAQVWRQWQSGKVAGVSKLLFVGQFSASLLFLAYSVLQDDAVFVAVNAFMVANALVGMLVDARNRRLQNGSPQARVHSRLMM